MTKTKIEWATDVWNPTVGCSKVSQGCTRCYAEVMANRLKAMGIPAYQNVVNDRGRWTGRIELVPERLDDPLRWRKPRRVFVNSMSDLFHEGVARPDLVDIWNVMRRARNHTFIVLTKRPKRMRDFVTWMIGDEPTTIPSNVWLVVSIEDQKSADERIPYLLQTPAAVRGVSAEPLLGEVDLRNITIEHNYSVDSLTGKEDSFLGPEETWNKLDWIVCGGESGHGARPMHPDWARGLRDQCIAAGAPFFFKQWGEWILFAERNGEIIYDRVGKKAAGRELDGRTWDEYPV